MAMFDPAFDYMLKNEVKDNDPDEVVENPRDPGGITKYGVSLRLLMNIPPENLKNYGIYAPSEADLRGLKLTQAKLIYCGEFWDCAHFSLIESQPVANYLFDTAVNIGIAPAVKCAQRACWSVFNVREYLPDDGILGAKTLEFINSCESRIIHAIRSERAGHYRAIVAHNPAQQEFLEGWLNRAYRH